MRSFYRVMIATTLLAFFSLQSVFHPSLVQANENFTTDLTSTYEVAASGETTVTHDFKITNTKPLFFVTQYAIKISSPKLAAIAVTSNGTTITPQVVTTENQTAISFEFPDKVVGEGQVRQFTVSYKNPDLAQITGQVLEVSIPELASGDGYQSYRVNLITPIQFGSPVSVVPEPMTSSINNRGLLTTFSLAQPSSIVAFFGTEQVFNLDLTYVLENTTQGRGIAQIALPPDTSYQRIVYSSIDPLPFDIEADSDGNWIATYRLDPGTVATISALGQARLTLEPNEVPVIPPQRSHQTSQEYWNTKADIVTELLPELSTPRAIYDYLVETMTYNYDRLETDIARLGAEAALQQPDQALCQEYTDSFITLARANNIPARRLTGYAYTRNTVLRPLSLTEDILHAWPDYYDTEMEVWRPIDPTWGQTTGGINYFDQFDLNHIVFAINGVNSRSPYPVGSYRTSSEPDKQVNVTFGGGFMLDDFSPEVSLRPVALGPLSLPLQYQLTIRNTTGTAFYAVPFTFSVPEGIGTVYVHEQSNSFVLDTLLPYQEVTVPVFLQLNTGFVQQGTIDIQYETGSVTSSGWFINPIIAQPNFFLGLGITSIFIALGAGSILVFRSKR